MAYSLKRAKDLIESGACAKPKTITPEGSTGEPAKEPRRFETPNMENREKRMKKPKGPPDWPKLADELAAPPEPVKTQSELDVALIKKHGWFIENALNTKIDTLAKAILEAERALLEPDLPPRFKESFEGMIGHCSQALVEFKDALKELKDAGLLR